MYQLRSALVLIWTLFLLAPAIAQPDDKLVFIHTADLGDVISGVHDDPLAPTLEEAGRVLRNLKLLHPDALFLDSGNIHGPLAGLETQFSPPAKALMMELEPFAINYGSRDMLYSPAHAPGVYSLSLRGLPLISTAEFPKASPDFVVQRQIEKTGAGRSLRAIGISSLNRAKTLLEVTNLYQNTDLATEKAIAYLNDPATSAVELNLILSDLPPAENDALAARLPANSLIFEQAIYGIDPGQEPPPVRQVSGITIVSKRDWWSADIVEVQVASASGASGPLSVIAAAVTERHPYNPWFNKPKPSLFGQVKRIFGKKPPPPPADRKATVELPNIGERLRSYEGLRRIFPVKILPSQFLVGQDLKAFNNAALQNKERFQIREFRARGLPGADQRKLANVYFYRLVKDGELKGDFMKVYRSIIPSMTSVVLLVGFDENENISFIHVAGASRISNTQTLVNQKYLDSFIGKNAKQISLKPSQTFGVEFHADYLMKDLRTACNLYRQAKRRAKEITDDQDFEDLIRR